MRYTTKLSIHVGVFCPVFMTLLSIICVKFLFFHMRMLQHLPELVTLSSSFSRRPFQFYCRAVRGTEIFPPLENSFRLSRKPPAPILTPITHGKRFQSGRASAVFFYHPARSLLWETLTGRKGKKKKKAHSDLKYAHVCLSLAKKCAAARSLSRRV